MRDQTSGDELLYWFVSGWSNNPNAANITRYDYFVVKRLFAGVVMGLILHVFVLFLQCMSALFSSVNRARSGIKWWLVVPTVTMFAVSMIYIAIDLSELSIIFLEGVHMNPSSWDDRGAFMLGLGWPNRVVRFSLVQGLSDGLLLYRCYVIYSPNYWIMIIPSLLYLTSVAVGIGRICLDDNFSPAALWAWRALDDAYFPIYVAINTLLTLMITARLIWHSRQVREAIGSSSGLLGPYTFAIRIIVESYGLYALALLMYIIPATGDNRMLFYTVASLLAPVQLIAPYLMILRVANRRESRSEAVSSVSSIKFESLGTADDNESLPDESLAGLAEESYEMTTRHNGETGNEIEEVPRDTIIPTY